MVPFYALLWLGYLATSFYRVVCNDIDASRLLVATVVDGSGPDIVRDSITLFRSIRKFGGKLNHATLLACFAVSRIETFVDDSLLRTYYDMGVAIDFIPRVYQPFPGTMNKYSTFFKFDFENYDYFLWLDADVVVFADPIPLFPDMSSPGKIYCVPELYNYMVRFPTLNQTDIVWNSKLPPFVLGGDLSVASHGVCNTGMLLLDRLSMSRFRSGLFEEASVHPLLAYRADRFLDSLFFVATVNTHNIEVIPLPYTLNYMALLEDDIMELFPGLQPAMVHLIANTTLTCYAVDAPPGCTCMYANDGTVPRDSQIVERIQSLLLPVDTCVYFAAAVRTPHPSPLGRGPAAVSAVSQWEHTLTCTQPSGKGHYCEDLSVPRLQSAVLMCPPEGSVLFFSGTRTSVVVVVRCCVLVVPGDPCSCGQQHVQLLDTVSGEVMGEQRDDESVPVVCSEAAEEGLLLVECHKSFIVSVFVSSDQVPVMPKNVTLVITSDAAGSRSAPLASVTLLAVSRHFLPLAARKYTADSVWGHAAVVLDAQDHLGEFLNNRRLVNMGVALCCDSYRGLHAVERLIEQWGQRMDGRSPDGLPGGGTDGAVLVLLVDSFPTGIHEGAADSPSMFASREDLVEYLSARCHASHEQSLRGAGLAGCVVSGREGFNLFRRGAGGGQRGSLYRKAILSFLYIDTCGIYADCLTTLREWYPALQPGGVLMGSVYAPVHTHATKVLQTLPLESFLRVAAATSAVDDFAYFEHCTVMATYLEHLSDRSGGGREGHPFNTLPAWYILKEMNIPSRHARIPRS